MIPLIPVQLKFKKTDCCVPLDLHATKGNGVASVVHTEVSVILQFGTKAVKVCQLDHFHKNSSEIESQFPLPHPITSGRNQCGNVVCQNTCGSVLSVYSVKFPQAPVYSYCSLRCCMMHLEGLSDISFWRAINNIPEIKKLKQHSGTQGNKN